MASLPLLLLLSALLHHAAAICLPRSDLSTLLLNTLTPSPATAPHPSDAPATISSTSSSSANTQGTLIPGIPNLIPTAVSGMCDRTTYPELCRASFSPGVLGGGGGVEFGSVLEMHLRMGRSKTVAAWTEFDALARTSNGGAFGPVLDECKTAYKESLDGYDAALEALAEGDISTVQINLDAVLQGYDDCGSGDAPGDPSAERGPWVKHNEELRKLTDNCFDLARFLK